jgi:hypothetical protein
MINKYYAGRRCDDGMVYVLDMDGKDLDPRLDLRSYSSAGFGWGYGGAGSAQLALAILADYCKDDLIALALCEQFKRELLAPINNDIWKITAGQIDVFLMDQAERFKDADVDVVMH